MTGAHKKIASSRNGIRKAFAYSFFSGFTIAELVVVIAVLAVLATIWFLSLSWYREDSKDAALKSNVRSLYSAITLESVSQSRSPRYFVRYETGAAFTGSSMVVFDRTPVVLVGGEWDVPGTNYTAWTPRYDRLRLDPEKFRLSDARFPRSPNTASAENSEWPYYVGIVEGTGAAKQSGGNASKTYSQVGTLLSNKTAYVMGDYASGTPAAVAGLIKDRANPSATWALVEWAVSWTEPACAGTAVSWYSVPGLRNGESAAVRKNDPNGFWEIAASASCVSGTVHVSDETASCIENYVPAAGPSCIRDTCAGQAFDNAGVWAEAYPWAPGTGTWTHSETAGVCKFRCKSGYSWDGAACKKDCETPVSATSSWISYAFPAVNVLRHGESASLTGTYSFANGSLALPFDFSCSDGTNHVSVRAGIGGCETNYTWNSSWTSPACSADTKTFSCSAKPANSSWNSVSSYVQTWNGTAWAPADSVSAHNVTASTTECRFACDTNYTWNGSSCIANTRSAACGWSVPANAAASTAATYSQTWNGTAWAPSVSWVNWAASCGFACNANYTWNGSSCVADTRSAACTWLPANASWNTVSSITQTWNGTAWAPTAVGSQNATASTTECRYDCDSWLGWDGNACLSKWALTAVTKTKAGGSVTLSLGTYYRCVLIGHTYDGDGTWICRVTGTQWWAWSVYIADEGGSTNQVCKMNCMTQNNPAWSITVWAPCTANGLNGYRNASNKCCVWTEWNVSGTKNYGCY